MATKIKLTPASVQLFTFLWNDAPNWSGTPPTEGNCDMTKEERGNLTQLKRAGLLTTSKADGMTWVHFTDEGRAYGESLADSGKADPDPEEWTYGDGCQCGCGGQPKGARSRFLPGHDARRRAVALYRADRVIVEDIEPGTPEWDESDRALGYKPRMKRSR